MCLYYHPKVIAAACIQSAMLYRQQNGMDAGLEQVIKGHKWYKWIDADIESPQIIEILTHMKSLYAKQQPVASQQQTQSQHVPSTH